MVHVIGEAEAARLHLSIVAHIRSDSIFRATISESNDDSSAKFRIKLAYICTIILLYILEEFMEFSIYVITPSYLLQKIIVISEFLSLNESTESFEQNTSIYSILFKKYETINYFKRDNRSSWFLKSWA